MAEFEYPVVAVGSSAGGIEALKQLVECIPADTKATFIVLQHLAPDHESQLVSILSRSAKLPCHEAKEDVAVEPGSIYVLPPDRYLSIVDHGLFVEPPHEPRGSRMPVDYFMRSLADAAGSKAIGVVLSGTGSDGTLGLRAIKGAGGLTFAQSPETALYDGMPRAAIDSDNVDEVATISDICQAIETHCQKSVDTLDGTFTQTDLNAVLALLKARLRYDFTPYKTGTIGRRVRRRMNLLRFTKLSDYLQHLRGNANELRQLADDMLINVTCFFRDDGVWEELTDKVLAPLLEEAGNDTLRIWVPACSTGEEAYTIAILLDEHCDRTASRCDWQIFATDLDEHAISIGREGLYPQSIAGDITAERLRKHFLHEGQGYRVEKRLRERVVFAKQNVLTDPPFSRLDLISCRNLMIYLDAAHQKKLLETFHFGLKEKGYLLLGTSETVSAQTRQFRTVSSKAHIFQRMPGRSLAIFASRDHDPAASEVQRFLQTKTARERSLDLNELVRRSLLDRYAPAGVVVDRNGVIQHYVGRVRRFVDTPEGEPTNNIYDLLPVSLRSRVREAVRRRINDQEAEVNPVAVRFPDRDQTIRIDCVELSANPNDDGSRYLVTFIEVDTPASEIQAGEVEDATYVRHLENELEIVREDLQTTVEELETSNEELKASHEEAMASNEELQSANEELETSREELQSLNEELVTVNHQLEDKIQEVEKATDDLRNLLASTQLPVLFLDNDLDISSFTTAMTELVELRESDLGRPFSDLATKIDDPDLARDAQGVLASLQPVEKQITGEGERIFLRRLQPYRTSEQRIGGVVATFTDITEQARTSERLASRERQARIIADLGQKALATRDLGNFFDETCALLRLAFDCDYAKILKLDEDADEFVLVSGAGWHPGIVGAARVHGGRQSQAGYTLLVENAVLVTDLESEKRFNGPSLLTDHRVRSGISTIITVGGKPWGVIGLHDRQQGAFTEEDLHILETASNTIAMTIMQMMREEFLTRERLILSLAMGVADLGLWTYDVARKDVTWDQQLREIIGAQSGQIKPTFEGFLENIAEDDRDRVREALARTESDGTPFDEEFRFFRPDGSMAWLLGKGERMSFSGRSMVFGINKDITNRKLADENTTFMMRELDHRVKNVLAIILSIAQVTSRTSGSIDDFHASFSARIGAIARTHSLLATSRWAGTNLRALVEEEVVRQASHNQVQIEGDQIAVSPVAAQAVSMLLHEMTTNALKYGALSTPDGSVDIAWQRDEETGHELIFKWHETGGPPVERPTRRGFGSKVIDRIVKQQLGASADITWEPSGLNLTVSVPMEKLAPRSRQEDATSGRTAPVSYEILKEKRVLVLDDEWLIADQHSQVFHSVGADIVGPFLSLKDAMNIDLETLDLAILDFALHNDGNVLPLADRLLEKNVPMLFVTGYGSNTVLPDRFAHESVVPKPASAGALLGSAAQLLDRRGLKDEGADETA